jgi:hypothetical protein
LPFAMGDEPRPSDVTEVSAWTEVH